MKTDELLKAQNNLAKVFEPYTNVLQSMNANTNILRSILNPSMERYISQIQQIGISNNVQQLLQADTALSKVMEKYNFELLSTEFNNGYFDELINKLGIQSGLSSFEVLINNNLVQTLTDALDKANLTNIYSYENLLYGLQHVNDDLIDIVESVYCDEEESEGEGFETNEEIYEVMEEQINNPEGFQARVANWSEKKKKQYHIVYVILFLIYSISIEPYLQQYIGVPVMAWTVAHVRELPDMASEFIVDLKENIEAIIIENVPYYFKISFADENGDTKQGYVSKRSVKFVNQDTEE